jgi:hypothetical protein
LKDETKKIKNKIELLEGEIDFKKPIKKGSKN